MRDIIHVVPRISNDENTVAVVTYSIDDGAPQHLQGPVMADDCMELLIEEITQMVKADEDDARAVWDGSVHDLNIGDVSAQMLDNRSSGGSKLQDRLAAKGVYDFRVQTFSDIYSRGNWTFDTVLVDEPELDDGD